MIDQYGRTIDYMRISITDRCNLRCRYCMPEDIEKIPMKDILTYEEIGEISRAAVSLGIRKFKITGGEPLVRKDAAALVEKIHKIPGTEQVTLTTNGILLKKCLPELLAAGLDGVNISLDTLDAAQFETITGKNDLDQVLEGIEAAFQAGIPVKINTVLQRDVNADAWRQLIQFAKDRPIDVRFIEMMPIGFGRKFEPVYGEEIREKIRSLYPDLEEDPRVHGNGPAVYVRVPGWKGSIGFISAIHGKFCRDCNRIRLTSTGKLKPCLCYGENIDLLPLLRNPADKTARAEALKNAIEDAIRKKPEAHCFDLLSKVTEQKKMVEIGG